MHSLRKIRHRGIRLLDWIYPLRCAACETPLAHGMVCLSCRRTFPVLREPFCEVCSQPFTGGDAARFTCVNCANRELAFTCVVAAFRNRGAVRDMIHRLKYNHEVHLVPLLGRLLAKSLRDLRIRKQKFDALIPVPLHPRRLRERGFNQAELLARELQRRANIPVFSILIRSRYTATQTQFDRRERMQNLRGAFKITQNDLVQNKTLLLVDDVITTGSTLNECAAVLKKAGASSVYAAAVARS